MRRHKNNPKVWIQWATCKPKWDAYAIGMIAPNYPVPATLGCVSLGQDYYGLVYINEANGDDWSYAYDQLHGEQLFPLGNR
jgi:hypothetical protein